MPLLGSFHCEEARFFSPPLEEGLSRFSIHISQIHKGRMKAGGLHFGGNSYQHVFVLYNRLQSSEIFSLTSFPLRVMLY